MRTMEYVIPSFATGLSIEAYLRDELTLNKKMIHFLRMSKDILINGESVPFQYILKEGDEIILPVLAESKEYVATPYDLEVCYEDDYLMVINKPQELKVHPNDSKEKNTLSNAVAAYLLNKGETNDVRYIHRLDEGTSGAILFAKNAYIQTILDRALSNREISRNYVAICEGSFDKKTGTIRERIGKDRNHSNRRRVSPNGELAITHYQVIERLKNSSLVSFNLETGRTHQIRVHIAHIGHPIVGDVLYGRKSVRINHQALHAAKISLLHPITRKELTVEARMPRDMQTLLDYLK